MNEVLLGAMCLVLMLCVVRMAFWIMSQATRIRELEREEQS